jgi:hypothetical protein
VAWRRLASIAGLIADNQERLAATPGASLPLDLGVGRVTVTPFSLPIRPTRPFLSRPRAVARDSAESVEEQYILSIITGHQFLKAVDDLGPQRSALCETFKLERYEPRIEIPFVLRRRNVDGRQKLIAHLALGACGRSARREPTREVLTRRAGACPIDQSPKRAEAILRYVFDCEAVLIILGVEGPRSARRDSAGGGGDACSSSHSLQLCAPCRKPANMTSRKPAGGLLRDLSPNHRLTGQSGSTGFQVPRWRPPRRRRRCSLRHGRARACGELVQRGWRAGAVT